MSIFDLPMFHTQAVLPEQNFNVNYRHKQNRNIHLYIDSHRSYVTFYIPPNGANLRQRIASWLIHSSVFLCQGGRIFVAFPVILLILKHKPVLIPGQMDGPKGNKEKLIRNNSWETLPCLCSIFLI